MDFPDHVPSYEHIYKLGSLQAPGGPHFDAFVKVSLEENPEGYEISPLLLDLLHTNRFTGNRTTEDPYSHIDHFEEVCGTFRMNAFTDRDVKLIFLVKLL